MTELLKLLDGSVDDVKAGLAGKSQNELKALAAAEKDGKTRKGVLEAIEAAQASAGVTYSAGTDRGDGEAHTTTDVSRSAPGLAREGADNETVAAALSNAAGLDDSGPANIAPATEVEASGAPHQIVPDVDMSHPAVDADPRANTTVDQNRIDFNDPTLSGQDAVKKNLENIEEAAKSKPE